MSFPALDVMMRARPATVFRERYATVAANRLALKRFASAGRGVNYVARRIDVVPIVARVGFGSRRLTRERHECRERQNYSH